MPFVRRVWHWFRGVSYGPAMHHKTTQNAMRREKKSRTSYSQDYEVTASLAYLYYYVPVPDHRLYMRTIYPPGIRNTEGLFLVEVVINAHTYKLVKSTNGRILDWNHRLESDHTQCK